MGKNLICTSGTVCKPLVFFRQCSIRLSGLPKSTIVACY